MSKRSRIMAIDYGDARTGVAVSDESQTLVGDAWVINEKRKNVLAQTVIDEAISRRVKTIVVGLPKNMDGSHGFRAVASETFTEALRKELSKDEIIQKLGTDTIGIEFADERLTTMMAGRILRDVGKHGKKQKGKVDAVAASLILESYMLGIRD